jgi:cell division protein FtsN
MKFEMRKYNNMFAGVGVGIVVGVLLSLLVVWYMNRTTLPFRNQDARPPVAGTDRIAPLPGKPDDKIGDKSEDKPRFEFYKILPGGQETTPTIAPNDGKPLRLGEPLWLQAGAFQNPAEADNMRARLALIGIDAGIQEVALPDKGTVYRVRMGPFQSTEEMNQASRLLSQNGIQATQVKNK